MTIFYLPDLGEGLPDAEIHEWFVKEGDEIKADQPMVAMETAKAVVEVPAPYSGKITQLYGKKGDIIKTDAPLIAIETADGKSQANSDHAKPVHAHTEDTGTVVGNIQNSGEILSEDPMGIRPQHSGTGQVAVLPAIRILAKQLGVELSTVTGTGPHGRISAADVQRAKQALNQPKTSGVGSCDSHSSGAASANSASSNNKKSAAIIGEPLRGVRRAMAMAMSQSHAEIVPVTITDDAILHAWSAGNDITLRVIRAIVQGVRTEPAVNAWFQTEHLARQTHDKVNLGLAMDSPEGLFVPVLQDVGNTASEKWRQQIDEFKKQVNARAIPAEALRGATIMLTNFGIYAGRYATPVLAPPCVAILGTGKLRTQACVVSDKIAGHRVMPLSLTVDHRAVTGGEAARFLAAVIADLELAD